MLRFLLLCSCLLMPPGLAQQAAPPASATQAIYQANARNAQRKFDHIRQNAARSRPDPGPTRLTENEMNAWLSSGEAQLPTGVKKVQLHGEPGVINATADVDFDQITAGRRASNPLLKLFRGTHEVQAKAHAQGSAGQAEVHVDSVSLDGVALPRAALAFFIDRYVKRRYPQAGLDTDFKLPYKIDTAAVGMRQLTITQK